MATNAAKAYRRQRMQEALKPPTKSHPVVAAVLLSHASHQPNPEGDMGATLDLSTNRVLEHGSNQFMVGGEPDKSGTRIDTQYAPSITPLSALQMMEHVRTATGGDKGASVGTWKNPDTGVYEGDASRAYPTKEAAMSTARKRNEEAIFSMKTKKSIVNPDFDPDKPKT